MPTADLYLGFLVASLVCIVAPGPDNLGVLSVGMSRGRRAGIGFAVGCGLGCLSHTLWAVVGISALIASSQSAFRVLQYAGAAYLFYLGIKALRSRGSFGQLAQGGQDERGVSMVPFVGRGFVSNALNPKVALFFLAFLPQFVAARESVSLQIGLLGVTFSLLTMLAFATLGYFSGVVGEWIQRRSGVGRWLDRATGCVFLGLGTHLALAGRRA